MKVHYINILMFAVPLNILVYNQRNHKSITYHTQNENPIKIHRSLCECELYAPQNYDNDPEMKSVMQDFDRQTSERLREYDERMNKNRKKCKDQCDKDIQKIILKDKIEKELKEKLATLETNINTKDLPICECEKSLTDKVEKGCLGCGLLGSGIAPNVGLFGEVALGAWKTAALVTAKELAAKSGALAGEAARIKAGIDEVVFGLESEFSVSTLGGNVLKTYINAQNYKDVSLIYEAVYTKFQVSCLPPGPDASPGPFSIAATDETFCSTTFNKILYANEGSSGVSIPGAIKNNVETIVLQAKDVADAAAETATKDITTLALKTNTAAVDATYANSQIVIIASIVAILVIVLVMIIIYLILRYRRKKKMKKKLQYIKLLKE
ncbi:surface antigen [Plasmodium falciparum UGT5.1]|uniref:Surface antigen n=1 Tax=Plasmodium falciparum UGT5.1 TaxID=1237627 RepID=W7JFA9_PLAFA|nr:surface antigen [Plasmodium falciparum UGT5.1]